MLKSFKYQLLAKCKHTETAEPTAASTKTHSDQIIAAMTDFCDFAPTVDILDVLLEVYLRQCREVLQETAAVMYLTNPACQYI